MRHTTSHPRINVTFSEDDTPPKGASNPNKMNAVEAKLKASIFRKFQRIHENYAFERLPALGYAPTASFGPADMCGCSAQRACGSR